MSINLKSPVIYLEDSDFDNKFKPRFKMSRPMVVMVQGSFCGHCTDAKPAFQKCANIDNNVNWATIQVDGETSSGLGKSLRSLLSNYNGVPHYFAINESGNIIEHSGGRSSDELLAFSNSLI
jgi:thiol-disulfide isomerase/thioredoxin